MSTFSFPKNNVVLKTTIISFLKNISWIPRHTSIIISCEWWIFLNGFCSNTHSWKYLQRKKSSWVKSGDRGSHGYHENRPINFALKIVSKCPFNTLEPWQGAPPYCWDHRTDLCSKLIMSNTSALSVRRKYE